METDAFKQTRILQIQGDIGFADYLRTRIVLTKLSVTAGGGGGGGKGV